MDNNQVWRMNFLCNDYEGEPIELSYKYHLTGTYIEEQLISRSIGRGYEDMALIIGKCQPNWVRAENQDAAWSCALKNNNPKMIYALLHCNANIWNRFTQALQETTHEAYSVFITGGFINPNHTNLMRIIPENNSKAVMLLINSMEGDFDISQNNNAALKEAERHGYYDIAEYFRTISNENRNTAVTAPKENTTGCQTYQKISDTELLRVNTSEDGNMKLTTIFNFEMRDITRTQYFTGQEPVQTCKNFEDLEDIQSLRPMFDKLIALDGNPPDTIFKHVTKVKIQKQP